MWFQTAEFYFRPTDFRPRRFGWLNRGVSCWVTFPDFDEGHKIGEKQLEVHDDISVSKQTSFGVFFVGSVSIFMNFDLDA